MPISHVIAHHLCHGHDTEVKLSLRSDELVVDEQKDQLLQKLKNSLLSRMARKHGRFSKDEAISLLQTELTAMYGGEGSFTQLCERVMCAFEGVINEHQIELDAHFLFFIEESDLQHVLYLFVVNQSQAQSISDRLDVIPSYFIDTGPSLFGFKVDVNEWKADSQYSYLTVLSPRANLVLSDFFDGLTGLSDNINKEESTIAFLEGVESFVKNVPEGKAEEFRAQVVDYCIVQDQKDEPVNIPGLSKALDGIDCDQFVKEMCSYNPKGEEDVMIDRKSLKRYVKFFGRDKDLSISFSTSHLNSRVHYDIDRDVLSIEGLPKSLRAQLMKHLTSE